jgi:hypothetical protein
LAKVDANDVAREHGPEGLKAATDALVKADDRAQIEAIRQKWGFRTVAELVRTVQRYRMPIVHGWVRRGEIVNVIAPPKAGKSWLTYYLGLSIASGRYWFNPDATCTQGHVLEIDNELHDETLRARIPDVREAMGLHPAVQDDITTITLRGKQRNILDLKEAIPAIADLKPRAVILDALYRFLPKGVSENDHADMTEIYNLIDAYAAKVGTATWIIVHHTSKGSQGNKSVVDVGSGANIGARATDIHMTLKEHETEGCFVVEGRVRTWQQPEPFVIRRKHPLWVLAPDEDPELIKGRDKPRIQAASAPSTLDDAAFARYLSDTGSQPIRQLTDTIRDDLGIGRNRAKGLIDAVVSRHSLHTLRSEDGPKDCGLFTAESHRNGIYFRLSPGRN